jgi:hypothetical protein
MIDVLYYGEGHDSQRVIDAVASTVSANIGYRYEPASSRDDNRSAWGVRVDADSVDEQAITTVLTDEFGSIEPVQSDSATIGWPAAATAFKTTNQTGLTGGVTTQIAFEETRGDVNGNWDLSNDKYVFPEDGDYEITYSIGIDNPSTGTINTFASINGGTVLGENRTFSTQPYSGFTSQASTVKQGITSGDELTLSIFTGNTLDVEGNNFTTFVTITKVA